METNDDHEIRLLAEDIGCGGPLARDLLKLAGGDASLVREASGASTSAEGVKAYILDHRISAIDRRVEALEK